MGKMTMKIRVICIIAVIAGILIGNAGVVGAIEIDMGTLLEGDCNGDNVGVNPSDWSIFQPAWGKCDPDPAYDPMADFNRDGCVNPMDWSVFQPNWGATGPVEV